MVMSNYLITFSGIIATYNLPIFVLTFGFGVGFLAILFFISENTIGKMDSRIDQLQNEVEELKRANAHTRSGIQQS